MKKLIIGGLTSCLLLAGCADATKKTAMASADSGVADHVPLLPTPNRKVLTDLLAKRRFEELEGILDQYRVAFAWDIASGEENLVRAYKAFEVADNIVLGQLDEWVEARPSSYQAFTARAHCLEEMGWQARGSAWASETKAEQFNSMNRFFRLGEQDARNALKLQPANIAPYRALVVMARSEGAGALPKVLVEALTKFPASFNLRVNALFALQPRWGGSYSLMEAFAKNSQQYAAANPNLIRLRGYPDWARGQDMETAVRYDEAFDFYTKALSYGEESDFLLGRNSAARNLHRFQEAFLDANVVKKLEPWREGNDSPFNKTIEAARDYAAKMYHEGRLQEAIATYSLLIEQVPDERLAFIWRGSARCRLDDAAEGIADLEHAVEISAEDHDANYELVSCLVSNHRIKDALEYQRRYTEARPGDGEGFLILAALYQEDKQGKAAIESMRQACSMAYEEACARLKKARISE